MREIESIIIPGKPQELFQKEFDKTIKEKLEKGSEFLDVKYQMSSHVLPRFEGEEVEIVYSALLLFATLKEEIKDEHKN